MVTANSATIIIIEQSIKIKCKEVVIGLTTYQNNKNTKAIGLIPKGIS